ncbi:MAG: MBL fold metallo-hydrolase [Acidimicrobiales bacterium]|jgi:glyoxylase-like metal-dependent hydrolase (beta-lactamase superfamily II)/rhodanese-related sulfurtransferase
MIDVITLSTPELGDRSYVLHNGDVGVAIDPQRDIERILRSAEVNGLRITHVAETHVHNDYVSGGRELARHLGVPYLVAADEEVGFVRHPVRDGEEIPIAGGFSLRSVATPGHTPHHLSYVALDRGRPVLACTGGSLLFGSVGRTDLMGTAQAVELSRQQYRSAHALGELPGSVEVLPTHGFGSFCSAGAAGVEASTIGEQRAANLAFLAGSEEAFVESLLNSLGDYPRYYHRMGTINRRGASAPDLSTPPLFDGEQLCSALTTEAWVVDLRGRGAFAANHLAGSLNFELDTPFTTYIGWLLPDDFPLILMAESPKAIAVAQLDLARVGIERPAGHYAGRLPPTSFTPALGSYPVRGFDDLGLAMSDPTQVALDVRRADEWEEGHLQGAVHVPLHHLSEQIDDLPDGVLWVHCAAGYRAAIAASLLARSGRDVVLVDGRFTNPGA